MAGWEPYPDLDDDQAMAFGLMAWSAVKLEGVVNRVCETAVEGLTTAGVSDHANAARQYIRALVQNADTRRLSRWLETAMRAIDRRNTLIHVTTEFWVDIVDGEIMNTGTLNLVNKRKKRIVRTALTSDSFRDIQSALDAAYTGWKDAEHTVMVERRAT
jgi:hypothetical protein